MAFEKRWIRFPLGMLGLSLILTTAGCGSSSSTSVVPNGDRAVNEAEAEKARKMEEAASVKEPPGGAKSSSSGGV